MKRLIQTTTLPEGTGFVVIGQDESGFFLDCEERFTVPEGATEITEGTARYDELTESIRPHVLERTDVVEGEVIRGKQKDIEWGGDLPEAWAEGTTYQAGDVVMYQDQAYECVTGHTAHVGAGWTPVAVPALWKTTSAPGVIPEWVQPLGAHDAYSQDAKVYRNGKLYASLIPANVWEPGTDSTLWIELQDELIPHRWLGE